MCFTACRCSLALKNSLASAILAVIGANPFVGTFEDPAHNLAKRTISYIGGRDYQIDGADEDGKPWRAVATRKAASSISVDFSSKGGPSAVEAKQLVKSGDLKFPDGNVWKRV